MVRGRMDTKGRTDIKAKTDTRERTGSKEKMGQKARIRSKARIRLMEEIVPKEMMGSKEMIVRRERTFRGAGTVQKGVTCPKERGSEAKASTTSPPQSKICQIMMVLAHQYSMLTTTTKETKCRRGKGFPVHLGFISPMTFSMRSDQPRLCQTGNEIPKAMKVIWGKGLLTRTNTQCLRKILKVLVAKLYLCRMRSGAFQITHTSRWGSRIRRLVSR